MRFLALIGVCLLGGMALSACGGASSQGSTTSSQGSTTSSKDSSTVTAKVKQFTDSASPPKVKLPPGPPPKNLVVRDLKVGSGPALPAKGLRGIRANFVSLSYRTGKPVEVRWEPEGAFYIAFGMGLQSEGWEKGLVGMKAGGRRELEIPARMANGHGRGSIFYVVDLLSVGPLEQ